MPDHAPQLDAALIEAIKVAERAPAEPTDAIDTWRADARMCHNLPSYFGQAQATKKD